MSLKKIGIFSDIHGNKYAFIKVWKALKKEKCDLYFFLGDICGYYYFQDEIIDTLKNEENLIAILGNHDALFLNMMNEESDIEDKYTQKYGMSCKILKESIKKTNLEFLKKMTSFKCLEEYKIAAFHGSPWNHLNEYVYPQDPVEKFGKLPFRFVLLGHTHYPMDRRIGNVRIINPGSSGQPRDSINPSYAILDLRSESVIFKRVFYDSSLMVKEVVKRKESNRYLTDVLLR